MAFRRINHNVYQSKASNCHANALHLRFTPRTAPPLVHALSTRARTLARPDANADRRLARARTLESIDDHRMAGSSKAKTAAAAAGRATARMAKTGDVIPLADAKASRKSKKDLPRVIYVGHVPHGFYETQMREYFGQFGDVTRVKVSRNKKTGRSKHYAFIEFKHPEVASIVAESMNNYLLANQVLKVTLIEPEKVHPKTFEGTGTKFKKVPWQRRAAAKHNKDRTDAEKAKRNKGLVKAEDKRRAAIAAAGIDYEFPGYKAILSTEKPKAKKASTPAKKASTPAKSLTKEKMTPKKTPAKVKKTPAKKDVESTEEKKKTPTPVARKTRGALKRTNETPAKPAKKAKQ